MLPIAIDLHTRSRYAQGGGIQRIIPEAVARPSSRNELQQAIAWAIARHLSITPRGAGSAMSGSAVGDGLVLDLTALINGERLEVLPHAGRIRAVSSVSLGEIASAAAAHGLRLGPDPSSAPWATLGGAISTNAAGARSYRLGAMDQWVESLELHTVDGPLWLRRAAAPDRHHPVVQRFQDHALPVLTAHHDAVMKRWPRTRKNTAGYALDRYFASGDLIDLVVGSEGTLGVITAAELRLEPIPAHRAALRVALSQRSDLNAAIAALGPANPTMIELLDRSLLELVADRMPSAESAALWLHSAAMLLVDLEADSAQELLERLDGAVAALNGIAIDVRTASVDHDIEELWSLRHHASPILASVADGRRSLQVIEDGCVPPEFLGRYLDAVDGACAAAGLAAVMFGHAGDGHVHVNLLPDPQVPDWLARVRTVFAQVNTALHQLGGTPAGEHGAGRLRAGMLPDLLGPEAITCFAAVKRAFDPNGLFNPGVILSDGSDPFARLKVGEAAVVLPDGLDAQLRRIE